MRIGKGIWLGLVGALLAGGAEAIAEGGFAAAQDSGNDVRVSVPVGHIGDRIAYSTFHRASPEAAWERTSQRDYQVTGVGRAPDRTGLEHDVVYLASNTSWKTSGGILGKENANNDEQAWAQGIDLSTRDEIRIEQQFTWSRQAFFVMEPTDSGTQYTYGPDEAAPALFGADVFVQEPLLIWQGRTFAVGDEVPDLTSAVIAREQRRIHWDVGAVDVRNLDARAFVSETGLVGEQRAVAVRLEGCADLVAPDPAYDWYYSDSPFVDFLGFRTPIPSRPCFTVKVWISASAPYPLLIESRSVVEGSIQESRSALAAFEAGSTPIPWSVQPTAARYRSSNPDLERSPSTQTHPADGSQDRLTYPMSAAVRAVSQDASLIRFYAWKLSHPGAHLVGATLTPTGPQNEGRRWSLVFGGPAIGKAYVVETERANPGALSIQSEAGEFPLRTFTESPSPHVTWAGAEQLWKRALSQPWRDLVPNRVAWGFAWHDDMVICSNAAECRVWEAGFYSGTSPEGMALFYRTPVTKQFGDVGPEQLSDAALYMDSKSGNIWLSRDGKRELDVKPLVVAEEAAVPSAVGDPPAPARPSLARAAIASTSVLALFLLCYFAPVLKWVGGNLAIALPGYAKLHKSQLLNNKVRESMVQAIRAEPGITPPELQRITGAGWSTVVYHLSLLEKNKMVSSLLDGRHKRFFPYEDINWNDRGKIAALKNARTRELYEIISQEPGVGPMDLAKRVTLSRQAVYWHVERLERAGLVGRDRVKLRTAFFANPEKEPVYDPKAAVEVV